MSGFYDLLDEYLGDGDAISDIRVAVRKLYFYDFDGYPVRMWQGGGKLFTSDGNEWLGSIDGLGNDHHKAPAIQDGRDGSSPTYNFSMSLIDVPGQSKMQVYDALKADQWRAINRTLSVYLAIFKEGEALRPQTPIAFFKDLTMISVKFAEAAQMDNAGTLTRKYTATVMAKDGNSGRASVPNGTYADTVQKRRAAELGVQNDRGCEFLALLANRTYQIP